MVDQLLYKVSVVVPVYNKENDVIKSINSIISNSVDEIIIIDDCSTDSSQSVIKKFIQNYAGKTNIILHKLKKNMGPGYSRNEGVRLSRNELIAFNDADDIWLEDKIKIQFEEYKDNKDVLISNMINILPNGKKIFQKKHKIKTNHIENILFSKLSCSTPTLFLNKYLFNLVGGYDTTLRIREDHDFLIRLIKKGANLKIMKENLALRVLNKNNYSQNVNLKLKLKSELMFINKFRELTIYKDLRSKVYLGVFKLMPKKIKFQLRLDRMNLRDHIELFLYKCIK